MMLTNKFGEKKMLEIRQEKMHTRKQSRAPRNMQNNCTMPQMYKLKEN
jgi:hypothetical protein